MSPMRALLNAAAAGFPRVSGDEPENQARQALAKGFSPRERG